MHRTSSPKIGAVPAHAAVMERKRRLWAVCPGKRRGDSATQRATPAATKVCNSLRAANASRSQRKTVFRKVHRCEAIQLKNATGAFGYGWGTPIARTRS